MKLLPRVLAPALIAALAGCGGGGSNPAINSGRAVIKITWPDRSRLIPTASNSIRVAFIRGTAETDSKVIARPATGNQTSTTFQSLKTGAFTLTAVAFPNANATGVPQANGTIPVTIVTGQTANVSLTMASTIDHLELTPPNPFSLQIGASLQLSATAKDPTNSVVLMSPIKLQWLSSNTSVAAVDSTGKVVAAGSGNANITITDSESGKSATTSVTVTPGTLVADDSFVYLSGANISGLDGGSGWSGGWGGEHGTGTPSIVGATGLAFGKLKTAGACFETTSGLTIGDDRTLSTQLGQPGTTAFFSILMRPLDPIGSGSFNGYFHLNFGNVAIGKSETSGFLGIENLGGGGLASTGITPVQNTTYFLVVRVTFTAGDDTFDLWVNPTPGQPLPATPDATKNDVDAGTVQGVDLGAGTRVQFDELRIGRTWEDVSPVIP